MGKVIIKNVNVCVSVHGRGYRVRTEHEMGIVDVKKTYTLPGLLKNKENVRIGDSVVLQEFVVPETTMDGKEPMRFDTQSIKDTATVYDIKDGKIYLVFNHALFQSAMDFNNERKWEDTQLCKYIELAFKPAMEKAGIPAEEVSLLSKDEIFGEERLPFFNKGKNRIAFSKDEDCSVWYWLKDVASSADFCGARSSGYSSYDGASNAGGFVRPRFVIS